MKRHGRKPASSDLKAPTNHGYDSRALNPLYHFIWGVRFFLLGGRTLLRNSDLLSLSLVPMLLTLALLMGLIFGAA